MACGDTKTMQAYEQLKEWPDLFAFSIWCKMITITLSDRHRRCGLSGRGSGVWEKCFET